MMKHIHPTEAQKNRMLNNALSHRTEKKSFKLKYCAIAAAACVAFSTTVFADEIKETFYNLLGADEIVSQDVLSNIYSDTDGHVTMTVKEVLSDNITTRAIIEYMAHDDEGKQWLANMQNVTDEFNDSIFNPQIEPCFKDNNTALYGVCWSYGCDELKEYSSDTTRVFELSCEASGENASTNSITLSYCLIDQFDNETVINVSESVELKEVKLDGVKSPDKHYRLTGVKYSPLSIMIYGENLGLYEAGINENDWHYIYSLSDEEIDSCCLIMKDGTKRDFINPLPNQDIDEWFDLGGGGWSLGSVTNPELDYDVSIYCQSFGTKLDVENVAGIELDGIYYSLE